MSEDTSGLYIQMHEQVYLHMRILDMGIVMDIEDSPVSMWCKESFLILSDWLRKGLNSKKAEKGGRLDFWSQVGVPEGERGVGKDQEEREGRGSHEVDGGLYLSEHRGIHTAEKPSKCPECRKPLVQRAFLTNHRGFTLVKSEGKLSLVPNTLLILENA